MHRRRSGLLPLIAFALSLPAVAISACPNSTVDTAFSKESAAKARAFLEDLKSAIRSDDRQKVAGMVRFPLRVIGNGQRQIRSRSEFLSAYEQVLTSAVQKAVLDQSSECLFGNWQGAMIGQGEIWFSEQKGGVFRIVTINPAISRSSLQKQ